MKIIIVLSLVLGSMSSFALTAAEKQAIDAYIKASQPQGAGQPIVYLAKSADLDGDGNAEIILLYGYQPGPSNDQRGLQVLTVFAGGVPQAENQPRYIVGAKGYRHLQAVEILDSLVTLKGRFNVAGGSMEQLPAYGEVNYLYADGNLQEQGGWWRLKE